MRFVLYGPYDPKIYTTASIATRFDYHKLDCVELDCDPVMIAFDSGGEIDRTYDMSRLSDWVDSVTASVGEPSPVGGGGYVQDPLPGLETPPCR